MLPAPNEHVSQSVLHMKVDIAEVIHPGKQGWYKFTQ